MLMYFGVVRFVYSCCIFLNKGRGGGAKLKYYKHI